jgi:hypothetical protein
MDRISRKYFLYRTVGVVPDPGISVKSGNGNLTLLVKK